MLDLFIVAIFLFAIYLTFKYKFIQFKCFTKAPKALINDKKKSSYQTFLVSLGSHLGTGNIVGVSTALIYGGAGTIFWMIVFSVFGSIYSLIENTLALKFRIKVNQANRGGASYYLKYGLNSGFFGGVFAILLVFTNTIFFQPIQINTISETLKIAFNLNNTWILIILFLFTFIIIFRGTKMIIKFSEIVVPLMSFAYLGIGLIVVIININLLPSVISKIFLEAFNFQNIFSGAASSCFLIGIKRSLFSNEAGLGTMPSISAMSEIEKPISQGYIQTLGVFIDTTVMCTLTGLMILIYDINLQGFFGCDLIIYIFKTIFGNFGITLASFFMLSFALATIVSQFYLGESNMLYLVINFKLNKKISNLIYKMLYLSGIIIGVLFSTLEIFNLIDIVLVILGIINIVAITLLDKLFKAELEFTN